MVVGLRGATTSGIVAELVNGGREDQVWEDTLVSAQAWEDSWLVVRHGEQVRGTAYTPGRRYGRSLQRGGGATRASAGRPPRRVVVECPARLLRSVTLVRAPVTTNRDRLAREVLMDVARSAVGIVIVTAQDDLTSRDMEQLRGLRIEPERVSFLNVGERPNRGTPDRGKLGRWAAARWYTWEERAAVAQTVESWGSETDGKPDRDEARRAAPSVVDDVERWTIALARELEPRKMTASAAVTAECSAIHRRCRECLGRGDGCYALPRLLEGELQALSCKLTRRVRADAEHVTREVGTALLGTAPDRATLARLCEAVRDAIEGRDEAGPVRTLTLTATAGTAVISGYVALDSLDTVGLALREASLAPVGICVTSNCYHLWRRRVLPPEEYRTWLSRAMRSLEVALRREIDRRYDELRAGLEIVADDAVEHGFLLM